MVTTHLLYHCYGIAVLMESKFRGYGCIEHDFTSSLLSVSLNTVVENSRTPDLKENKSNKHQAGSGSEMRKKFLNV